MPQSALLDPAALTTSWQVLDARRDKDYQRGHWPSAVCVTVTDWERVAKQADMDLHLALPTTRILISRFPASHPAIPAAFL